MDKQKIIAAIITQLEKDLQVLKSATLATYDAATNEQSKPENQYDTRALEASYLASAQAQRLTDLESLIYLYKGISLKQFTSEDVIDLTAAVEIEFNRKSSLVLVVPKGGGIKVNIDGKIIQTITPSSPLGEALMGLSIGDIAQVDDKDSYREYKIRTLF